MEAATGSGFAPRATINENDAAGVALPAGPVAARPCEITFGGTAASEAPRVEVRAWLQKLGTLTAAMTGGRVVIEAIEERRKQRLFQVRMELSMPDGIVIVGPDHPSNSPHEDVYVAIRNAFRAARRLLESRSSAPAVAAGIEAQERVTAELPGGTDHVQP